MGVAIAKCDLNVWVVRRDPKIQREGVGREGLDLKMQRESVGRVGRERRLFAKMQILLSVGQVLGFRV